MHGCENLFIFNSLILNERKKMAKAVSKRELKKRQEKKVEALVIGRKNIQIFLLGLGLIILGYILMAQPPADGFLSLHLAPTILIIAYLAIIPLAIMAKDKKGD